MKNFIFSFTFLFCALFVVPSFAANITLTCEISNCEEVKEIYLYQFEGFGFSKVETAKKGKDGKFKFKLSKGDSKFYYLGNNPAKLKPLILGREDKVTVLGTCQDFGRATVADSPLNVKYGRLKMEIGRLKAKTSKWTQQYPQATRNPTKMQEVLDALAELDQEKIRLIDSFGDEYPILTEIAAINTYLSFPNNQGDYYNEVDYFANEFFRFVDFDNKLYNYNPWVYEGFKEYARTLAQVNIDKALQQSYLDDMLNKLPAKSASYQMALSGIVVGLEGSKHPNYALYGKRLLKEYEPSHPEVIAATKKKIELAGAFLPGAVAPDFTQVTPAGDSLSLSDLRGKVVLVDFWASWCGPCRKENPHVKQIYEKYKDKGFDVLGVSLDRNKKSWEGAISKDGLPWHHISDLKGWKNAVANMYSVSSIPHTILLDQEGRIVASKLRGPQLEHELAKIFGE